VDWKAIFYTEDCFFVIIDLAFKLERRCLMQTIKLRSHVGSDGILKLEVPVGLTDTDFEVLVVIETLSKANGVTDPKAKTPEELGYPPGYFDETFGSLRDEPQERGPQGEYEVRDEIA
jgi:hypothetical protein